MIREGKQQSIPRQSVATTSQKSSSFNTRQFQRTKNSSFTTSVNDYSGQWVNHQQRFYLPLRAEGRLRGHIFRDQSLKKENGKPSTAQPGHERQRLDANGSRLEKRSEGMQKNESSDFI